jgi:hypothetical protein
MEHERGYAGDASYLRSKVVLNLSELYSLLSLLYPMNLALNVSQAISIE